MRPTTPNLCIVRNSVELAVNVVTTGISTFVGADVGGVLGAQLGSVVPVFIADAVRRSGVRVASVAETSTALAGLNGESLKYWLETPRNAALFTEALNAAWQALDEDKLKTLSQALADGLTDDAVLELSRLRVRTTAALDSVHLLVLEFLTEPPRPERAGWSRQEILERFPSLGPGIDPVLSTLDQSGCLVDVSGYGGSSGRQASEYGSDYLEFVRRAGGVQVLTADEE